MVDGLIAGKLSGSAQNRTAQNGKTFVTAKVRAASGDGDALFVNVIAFDDNAKAALLALADGDSVALAGTLTPKVWTDKHGDAKTALDMVAHGVLSAYHVRKRREAIGQASSGDTTSISRSVGKQRGLREGAALAGDAMPDDDVTF
ncbi:single-stranded DNA-binding protein [Trinickia dabaoshanensis]|uniref:Single-stranded DNA-binding protein n=1 Tax=Trinickia dabaoshanensis TaxID=564714 RepID=A0A2N7VPQ6_9BURK|nr:single-stranded DNA-binding protein [Trinickia dabaoshanensis]PMS19141.1 single-stranded DNA-binding protein [Trinickia dabaoshanensis]